MSQTQLAIDALVTVKGTPAIAGQLSYLGDLFGEVGIATYEMAGRAPIQTLQQLGIGALKEVGIEAVSILPQVLTALGAAVSAVSAVADVVPFVGQFLSLVMAQSAAQSQAWNEESALNCQRRGYEPAEPSRAKLYGGMLPTDTMHSTAGDLFAALERNFSLVDIPTMSGGGLLEGGSKIPQATRAAMRDLRVAIKDARDDPASDGGMALWPVYLDLVHAQFRQKRLSWKLVQAIYACKVLPPRLDYASGAAAGDHVPCGCGAYEQRAYREVVAILTDWQQTLEPKYLMDQAKAADLRKDVQKALAAIKAGGATSLADKIKKSGGMRLGYGTAKPRRQPTRAERVAQPIVVGAAVAALGIGLYKIGGWKALLTMVALPP